MKNQIDYLKLRAALGHISRREFMGRMGALGVSAALANTMLAGAVRAAGPQKGGTIRVGIQGGGSGDSLDPALAANATATMVSQMWGETLVELKEGGGLEGRVAESWSSTPDAKTWTFKIRSGVTFSNGKTVTAEDVLATLERHSGEDTKSGALGLLRDITGMRAEGDSFVMELNQPNADLPYLMADYHLIIQPNGGKDDPTAGIGTGPYVVKSAEPGVRFVFEKYPDHWDSNRGHASTVEMIVINDDTARMAALQSGQVDMVNRVPPRTAALVDRAPNITVNSKSGPGHYVFIMHCDTAPFDNNDVRMALKYGINRQEMVDKILFGYGSVGNDTPINASYPLFTDFEQREYDPDKAAHHWKKSGATDPILLRTSDNSFPGAPDAAALFQQSCAQAGIPVEIKREPNDGYWSEVWNAQPFCTSYWGGRPTQDQMFTTAYLSTADWNDTRFNNETFDQLLLAARAELDEAKRTQMYSDMSTIVRDEGGLICPMFNDFVDALSDRVAGYVQGGPGYELMNFFAPVKMWVAA
ncbi:peptide/nickel transport system substrate-binding protein [Lutimaribacter pacificus]|uniref:Peptide/nickel transport system substrate-binding protein n=1 Tax=Lutimaribacter pacificus TaxID=391948 RepID=A0A1H0D0S5_9RHOB|nr:ABC transporter substrate-binding protein [Lutimaribacter pacificus]SDN63461.1 peptide/nickel transport system substrate-binding protein [Lutimaribacter pacificus]SHJ38673.1 peptide/nickel transport system substrate-binding protein [Lutimaribacter pacificus]